MKNVRKKVRVTSAVIAVGLTSTLLCLPNNSTQSNYSHTEGQLTAGISSDLSSFLSESLNSASSLEASSVSTVSSSEEETELSYDPAHHETKYVNVVVLYYRESPTVDEDNILGEFVLGKQLDVYDCADAEWGVVQLEEDLVYVLRECLSDSNPLDAVCYSNPLNSHVGRVNGPSGQETYYNLDMSYCVRRMKSLGYEGDYWVREDGVKMFGDYVMVAADFDIRPLGTLVPTSLGVGIVVDTGTFTETNPYGLDIATTWYGN